MFICNKWQKNILKEFICGGAKNYAIRHVDAQTGGDEQVLKKIRGIQLSFDAHNLLTFERMRSLVLQTFRLPLI